MARRQPNIMQRGKSWVVYFRENGKQHWHSFPTKDAAEVYRDQERARMRRGERAADMKVDFRTAANRWHAHGLATGWRASTARDYRSCLDSRLLPEFGDERLARLNEQRIDAWLEDVRAELSARTIRKLLFVGGAVCERAKREYGITRNPFRSIEPGTKLERVPFEVFTDEDVWAIVRAAETEADAGMYLLAWRTGVRRGEIPPLLVRDLDFVGRKLHIRRNYVHGVVTTPKGKRERAVPLEQELARVLDKLLKQRGDPGADELLFPAEDGGLLDPDGISHRFRAAVDAAGVRDLPLKHLRHTYCSRLAADGVHVTRIQEWAGHVSITTTQGYMHFAPRPEDADRLDAAFAPKAIDTDEPPELTIGEQLAELRRQLAEMTEAMGRMKQEEA
jgi:integrase